MASIAASVKQKREPLKSPRRNKTLVTKAGAALQDIASHVEDTTSDIKAIVEASREQSTALSAINRAINTATKSTQQNAAMVEE
jgi:methyl-accepting chemotaxis protein